MDRLISDVVVRRTAQVVVLTILISLIGLCLCLAGFVHLRRVGYLGSGLIDQSQKMMVAAMQMADMKVCAHRS